MTIDPHVRNAHVGDVPAIRELINTYAELGLMLFRSLAELYENVRNFKVWQDDDGRILGCCAMAIMWSDLAEIRSLSVAEAAQHRGVGSALVREHVEEACILGLPKVFALTLNKPFFERLGFQKVPMDSLPMKVWSDCVKCPKQANCDEIAMVRYLDAPPVS